MVHQRQVRKVVNVHAVIQRHHHAVAPQPHSLHLAAETELTNAPVLVVVPDHDLVGWVARVAPAAHQRQYVATKQHFYHANAAAANAATAEVTAKGLFKGLAVIDAKASVGADSEASCRGWMREACAAKVSESTFAQL